MERHVRCVAGRAEGDPEWRIPVLPGVPPGLIDVSNAFQRIRRAWRVAAGVAAAVVAVLAASWWPGQEAPQFATAVAAPADIENAVVATGTIKPSKLVSVGAQASGRIESLRVSLGDKVKAGDLIAEIDSRTQSNALQSALANLESAKASRDAQQAMLAQYQQEFKRQQTMLAARASAQADYDVALANLKSARAQVRSLEAAIRVQETNVANARTNLEYTRITAPIDGTVLAVVARQGQTVNANQTTPTIVMLGDVGTMTVYAEISEADVVHAREGQDVYFTILGDGDRRHASRLRRIEPAPASITDEDTSSASASSSTSSSTSTAIYYNGVFDVDNHDDALRTYMTAQVHIVLDRAEQALVIPAAALGERGADGSYGVTVLERDGQPRLRSLRIGINNRAEAQVLSGLAPGERVVIGQASSSEAAVTKNRRAGGPPPMGF